jgi:transposase
MEQKLIAGVDVSKNSLDVFIKPMGTFLKISNDLAGFKQLKKATGKAGNILLVMEHTGHYSLQLERFCTCKGISYCKIPALQIKRSVGVVRGKTDKVDAMRIAEYAWLRKDQLVASELAAENILQLRNLLALRAKLVKDRSGYIVRYKEMKSAGLCHLSVTIDKAHKEIMKVFTTQIRHLETDIQSLIQQDHRLKQTYNLLRSIKGVGMIIAAYMIAITENFKKFSGARKFNCYAGLAPFQHESGTSIKARSRISHLANKEIKTLLNLGAFCAIRCNQELRQYYQKRVAEGKQKMSCLNIIRSKIVSRMFAVVKRQTPYQELPIEHKLIRA